MGRGFETRCTNCGFENSVPAGLGMLAAGYGDYLLIKLGQCSDCDVVESFLAYQTRYRCSCGHQEEGFGILRGTCPECGRAWEIADVAAHMEVEPNGHPACRHCGGSLRPIGDFPELSTYPKCKHPTLRVAELSLWDLGEAKAPSALAFVAFPLAGLHRGSEPFQPRQRPYLAELTRSSQLTATGRPVLPKDRARLVASAGWRFRAQSGDSASSKGRQRYAPRGSAYPDARMVSSVKISGAPATRHNSTTETRAPYSSTNSAASSLACRSMAPRRAESARRL